MVSLNGRGQGSVVQWIQERMLLECHTVIISLLVLWNFSGQKLDFKIKKIINISLLLRKIEEECSMKTTIDVQENTRYLHIS